MKWFLYVVVFFWGSQRTYRTPMVDFKACMEVVQTATKAEFADGDENESGIAWYCSTADQSMSYNGEWHEVE